MCTWARWFASHAGYRVSIPGWDRPILLKQVVTASWEVPWILADEQYKGLARVTVHVGVAR